MKTDNTEPANQRKRPAAIVVGVGVVVLAGLILGHVMRAGTDVDASAASTVTPAQCRTQPLAQSITQAALAAPAATQPDGSLYGVQRWTPATRASYFGLKFPGLLSCAYTVSAILRAACHPVGNLAAVSSVASALSTWQKIQNVDDLQAGDVVFWKPRQGLLHCPSDTHWHVGIAIGNGRTVDNDWWSGKPEEHSVHRLCMAFAYARRAAREGSTTM